jgi:queuosine precursor transporter
VLTGRFAIVSAFFVTCLLTANVLAVKLADVHGHVFPAGLVVFPLSYLLGDVLVEVYGLRAARRVIWTGFACNVLLVVATEAAIRLPPAPFWQGQQAYSDTLGSTSRLLAASFAAYLVGELANAGVMARMKAWTGGRYLWSRTIGSTVVGEGLDSFIFVTVAFAGKGTPLLDPILTTWAIKVGYEVIATPLTYAIVGHLKRVEGLDGGERVEDRAIAGAAPAA